MKLTRTLTSIAETLFVILILLSLYAYRNEISHRIDKIVHDSLQNELIIPSVIRNRRDYEYETVHQTDNFSPNSINDLKDIYFTVLNNGWNIFTFYCPFEYESCTDDTLSIANKSEYIELVNFYVSPFNNYTSYNTTVSSTGEIYLKINKLYSDDEINLLNNYVDGVLKDLNVNEKNPTKDDLRNIHDYIIKNVTYDTEYSKDDPTSKSNTAIGAIKFNKAICSGYTDLYALFLDRLNIKNIKLPSEEHIWNYVYFNDKWYHIDLTWDDDEVNKNNTHNFFMITTSELHKLDSEKHNVKEELYLELKNNK